MVVQQRSTILRQALILISQPSNALIAIRLIPPIWISHNFKATTLGMIRKKMRNRGFEPWTFKSCLGYQHFVINKINKKDSKKTSTATIAEIKTEANVTKKASTLVAATDHDDHMTFDSRQVSTFRPSSQKIVSTANDYNLLSVSQITAALSCIVIFWPEFCVIKDIQTRQTIGYGIKRGKLYYLDLQSKDSNKLQQALMTDESEGEKKKSEIWLWHRRLGHASFGHDIIHQTTCSNTPQQNGVAERKNRHLLEVVRASLIATKTPISYWGEAITSAAYLINRVPSSSINFQTPLQALTNAVVAPTVPNLPPRVFGCVAFVHLHKHQRTKLTSHALQCVFVGYALHKKGYRCYHPPTRQMYITMDVVFHEDSMYFSSESELQGTIPNSVQEALADPRWKAAMNEEMKSLHKNETWELVECPPGKKPVGCRWIYTVKYKADGSIERFKARLVAKGYTQTYGIDYTETFAPVAKINTVRDAWCQKSNVKGVQIEEVIVWVEAIPESMVWKETGMSGCQPVNTPIEKGLKLCVEPNQVPTDKGRYQRLVGRLMYLAHTRPDLAYALSVNAPGKGILFAKNVDHQSIEVYTDADWAGAVDDRRSTSGYFTFVGGNLVTWKSKKQNVVARSSAEAEFRGMALGLFKNEESYEESWAKLRIQLPRVNPDCKEKKQRESAMEHILDDSRSSHFWSTF
ncbi:Retrovirus-related Pol polyprotein from transposon TNT 1-94 [Vitis vinifera]|uniref:Retrovirus-related Pol polyprotein from transposon TNT 1-94 n=1 Tax=Vitis vinifera TaxID=29760 RepID=A0A438HJ97_VITVI|nr:Retrovirus-related Pol polyprotein from transposon TNT 1-94 [Vitis vinifera]